MSSIARAWRSLNEEYEILERWPVFFIVLVLSVLMSLPTLIAYTYFIDDGVDVSENSYYSIRWPLAYNQRWYSLNPSIKSDCVDVSSDCVFFVVKSSLFATWQLWRLFSSQLVSASFAEILLSSALIVYVSSMEKSLSTVAWKNYAYFAFFFFASMLCQVVLEKFAFSSTSADEAPPSIHCQPGLFWLFSYAAPFYLLHPPPFVFKIHRLRFSSNTVVYLLYLLYFFVFFPNSCISASISFFWGLLLAIVIYVQTGGSRVSTGDDAQRRGMAVGRRDAFEPLTMDSASAMASSSSSVGNRDLSLPPPAASSTSSSLSSAPRNDSQSSSAKAHGARPAAHYEKLLANAKKARSPKSGASASAPPSSSAPSQPVIVQNHEVSGDGRSSSSTSSQPHVPETLVSLLHS